MLIVPGGLVCAETGPKGEAYFVGVQKSDRVGKDSAQPDGKPDAAFTLTLPAEGSKQPITDIEIQSVSGPPRVWNTARKSSRAGFVGVSDSRRPSLLLNMGAEPLKIDPAQHRSLLLFVSDDGLFKQKQIDYQIKVTYADGKFGIFPVKTREVAVEERPSERVPASDVRMSAILKGISNYDAVSPGKKIVSDDVADGVFVLTVEAKNREIVALQIKNIDGAESVWDTVPSSRNSPVGVALSSDPERLLNNPDGTVRIRVKERVDLNLYVADNGSIKEGRTHYRVAITFSDGKISLCEAKPATTGAKETKEPDVRTSPTVNQLATWLGYVSTDAVGPYPEMKPDSAADAVFGLDIEAQPKNTITGIEIHSYVDPGRKWGTGGTTPGAWGLGVAYESSPGTLLNHADGSVNIPVEGRAQFYLYAADPGDIAKTHYSLRMIVHMADGSSFQQLVQRPAATTSTVAPEEPESSRAHGLITCEFRGFVADLVNTSARPGKDGYLDGTFITKLRVKDKTITKIELQAADGTVHWSTQPRAPVMILGVALYPKIFQLVETQKGSLNIPVSGRRTIYLYAADNGMLSNPNARLTVRVIFSDKTELSTEVIK